MAENDPQLLKGVLTMVLLKVLAEEEGYGYAVVVRLQELGFAGLAEGTIYPALTRLERQGFLAARLERSSSGPARKYYRTTPQGLDELARSIRSWGELVSAVAQVLESPVPGEERDMAKAKEA
ncbi:MAG: PadR family transcriptional regulator [Acidimicrobiales bacterium]